MEGKEMGDFRDACFVASWCDDDILNRYFFVFNHFIISNPSRSLHFMK